MVTYCMYAVFAGVGIFNAVQGRWLVALFYAVFLGVVVAIDRKFAKDHKAHEARMAESDAAHKVLMARLEEQTRKLREETARRMAEAQAYRDAHYFFQITVPKAEVTPLNEETEAKLRQEFYVACESFLTTLKS